MRKRSTVGVGAARYQRHIRSPRLPGFGQQGAQKISKVTKKRIPILLALLETVILCWIFWRQQYSGVGDILEHPGGSISAGGDDVRSGEPNAGQAGATSSQEKDEEEENQN